MLEPLEMFDSMWYMWHFYLFFTLQGCEKDELFSEIEQKMNLDIVYIDMKITRCVAGGVELGTSWFQHVQI